MRTAERRFALAGALVLYLAFVAYQSLAGGWAKACTAPLLDGGWSGSDALANLVAYVPAGLLAGAFAASYRTGSVRVVMWLAIVVFSLSMELAQACLGGRVSSWIDWATNSAGATLGFSALPLMGALMRRLPGRDGRSGGTAVAVTLAAWLVVGAWLAASTVPWRFTLDIGTVRANLAFLRLAPSFDAWAVARHAFAWMAVAAAIRALVSRRLRASVALVATFAVAIGLQALLEWHALSWSELAGAALGASVSLALLVPAADDRLARIAPALALLSVLAYELAPGHPFWAISGRFSWWPLVGRGNLLAALDFTLYFCWFAFVLVLALRWTSARARTAAVAGSLAVVVLLALEFAQRSIPGRTPDTSPALIVALAFVVAWLLTDRSGERATTRVRSRSHRPVVRSARRS
ncbi:MAG: VanZ family protein [Burkholderiaceae bacterium]|nr:VanZ family protein [Burkholderiaceae bacterium]